MPLWNQVNTIIYISICYTNHALSKYVEKFEKNYLIIIHIVSKLCMEFGKKKCFFLCINLFNILLFFEIKNITLCDEPSFFFF